MQFTSKLSPGRALRGLSRRLRSATGRLRRDEDGAIALMVAGSVFSIILVIGGSVDVYRYEMLRKRAQNTLDRAVLAAAALDQKVTDGEAVVRSYMKSAGLELPPGTTFVDCPKAGPAVCCPLEAAAAQLRCLTTWDTYKRSFRSMQVTANYEMEMAFLWLAGQEDWDVPVQAAALERERKVEVSLVLDLSGSMAADISGTNQRRIDALKPAAERFMDAMLSDDRSRNLTSISLVPYSGQTSLGRRMFDHLAGPGYSRAHEYSSCFRLEDEDFGEGVPDFANRRQGGHFSSWAIHESKPPRQRSKRREYFWKSGPKRWVPDTRFAKNVRVRGQWVVNSENWRCHPDEHLYLKRDPNKYQVLDDAGVPLPGTARHPDIVRIRDSGRPSAVGGREVALWKEQVWHHVGECERADTREQMHCSEKPGWSIPPAEDRTVQRAFDQDHIGHYSGAGTITYMSNDADLLKQRVRDMPLFVSTGTDVALKYAYMLVDPAFRSYWSSFLTKYADEKAARQDDSNQRPRDWDDPHTFKFIVLMTDGRIKGQTMMKNSAYTRSEGPIQYDTDLWKNADQRQKKYDEGKAEKNFRAVCESAQANNVEVFTVGFDLVGNDSKTKDTRAMLEDCASSPSHYFDVNDGDIDGAFQAIAAAIQKVRLTS